MPELQQTLYSISTNLYQQGGGGGPTDGGSSPDGGNAGASGSMM